MLTWSSRDECTKGARVVQGSDLIMIFPLPPQASKCHRPDVIIVHDLGRERV